MTRTSANHTLIANSFLTELLGIVNTGIEVVLFMHSSSI